MFNYSVLHVKLSSFNESSSIQSRLQTTNDDSRCDAGRCVRLQDMHDTVTARIQHGFKDTEDRILGGHADYYGEAVKRFRLLDME